MIIFKNAEAVRINLIPSNLYYINLSFYFKDKSNILQSIPIDLFKKNSKKILLTYENLLDDEQFNLLSYRDCLNDFCLFYFKNKLNWKAITENYSLSTKQLKKYKDLLCYESIFHQPNLPLKDIVNYIQEGYDINKFVNSKSLTEEFIKNNIHNIDYEGCYSIIHYNDNLLESTYEAIAQKYSKHIREICEKFFPNEQFVKRHIQHIHASNLSENENISEEFLLNNFKDILALLPSTKQYAFASVKSNFDNYRLYEGIYEDLDNYAKLHNL